MGGTNALGGNTDRKSVIAHQQANPTITAKIQGKEVFIAKGSNSVKYTLSIGNEKINLTSDNEIGKSNQFVILYKGDKKTYVVTVNDQDLNKFSHAEVNNSTEVNESVTENAKPRKYKILDLGTGKYAIKTQPNGPWSNFELTDNSPLTSIGNNLYVIKKGDDFVIGTKQNLIEAAKKEPETANKHPIRDALIKSTNPIAKDAQLELARTANDRETINSLLEVDKNAPNIELEDALMKNTNPIAKAAQIELAKTTTFKGIAKDLLKRTNDQELIEALLENTNENAKSAVIDVAKDTEDTEKAGKLLAESSDPDVIGALMWNRQPKIKEALTVMAGTTVERDIAVKLATSSNPEVIGALMGNPIAKAAVKDLAKKTSDTKIAEKLATSSDLDVIGALRGNTNAMSQPSVKIALASNDKIPDDLRKELAMDENPDVKKAAIGITATDKGIKIKAFSELKVAVYVEGENGWEPLQKGNSDSYNIKPGQRFYVETESGSVRDLYFMDESGNIKQKTDGAWFFGGPSLEKGSVSTTDAKPFKAPQPQAAVAARGDLSTAEKLSGGAPDAGTTANSSAGNTARRTGDTSPNSDTKKPTGPEAKPIVAPGIETPAAGGGPLTNEDKKALWQDIITALVPDANARNKAIEKMNAIIDSKDPKGSIDDLGISKYFPTKLQALITNDMDPNNPSPGVITAEKIAGFYEHAMRYGTMSGKVPEGTTDRNEFASVVRMYAEAGTFMVITENDKNKMESARGTFQDTDTSLGSAATKINSNKGTDTNEADATLLKPYADGFTSAFSGGKIATYDGIQSDPSLSAEHKIALQKRVRSALVFLPFLKKLPNKILEEQYGLKPDDIRKLKALPDKKDDEKILDWLRRAFKKAAAAPPADSGAAKAAGTGGAGRNDAVIDALTGNNATSWQPTSTDRIRYTNKPIKLGSDTIDSPIGTKVAITTDNEKEIIMKYDFEKKSWGRAGDATDAIKKSLFDPTNSRIKKAKGATTAYKVGGAATDNKALVDNQELAVIGQQRIKYTEDGASKEKDMFRVRIRVNNEWLPDDYLVDLGGLK